MSEKPKTSAQLWDKLSHDVKKLEERIDNIDSTIQQLAVFLDRFAKEYAASTQLVQRTEHFLYSLIKVGLDNGLSFPDLQKAMEQYSSYEDLLVFWGIRTQEEYEQLKAQAEAAQQAAQQVADEHNTEEAPTTEE